MQSVTGIDLASSDIVGSEATKQMEPSARAVIGRVRSGRITRVSMKLFGLGLGALIITLGLVKEGVAADSFPTKPVRIIVPAAPGGALDLTTRLVAQKMSENLGQPVIVDNRPGADAVLGTRYVKDQVADGYTILAQANGLTLTPLLKLEAPYDPIKDFMAIGVMTRSPMILEVGAVQPDHTVAELIARAKANPGRLSYASGGVGTPPQIACALFLLKAGLNVTHIPYKGNGAALPDVAGGRVDMICDGYISSVAYIKGDKLRALAVTSPARISPLPDVPTFVEQGVDYTYSLWLGLLAPTGTPQPVIQRLSEALKYAASSKDLSERFRAEGSDPSFVTPADFNAYLAEEYAQMGKLVSDLNLPKQ